MKKVKKTIFMIFATPSIMLGLVFGIISFYIGLTIHYASEYNSELKMFLDKQLKDV
jgi:ABC-type lipoprotein release transport system permease subunit